MTKKGVLPHGAIRSEYLFSDFHIEADAKNRYLSILISGVVGVNEFSDFEVSLLTRRDVIKIKGALLNISVMESKTVEISGKIELLSFEKRGRKYKNENR